MPIHNGRARLIHITSPGVHGKVGDLCTGFPVAEFRVRSKPRFYPNRPALAGMPKAYAPTAFDARIDASRNVERLQDKNQSRSDALAFRRLHPATFFCFDPKLVHPVAQWHYPGAAPSAGVAQRHSSAANRLATQTSAAAKGQLIGPGGSRLPTPGRPLVLPNSLIPQARVVQPARQAMWRLFRFAEC